MQSHEDMTQYEKYEENYSEDEFWKKLKGIPRSALGQVLEKALLLRELLFDSETPLWIRGTILGVLGYLILPIDIIPDVIPGVGFVDDLAAMGLVLANLDYMVTDDIRERVRKKLPDPFQQERENSSEAV